MENWGQGKTDLGLRIGKGHSQGILEPEEPINSLRGVECTDNEKETLGSWETQAIGTAAHRLWPGGQQAGLQPGPYGSVLLPSTTPVWRKQGANGFSVPPLVSRDVGSP